MLGPEYPLIEPALPRDHANICSAEQMLREAFPQGGGGGIRVLDFGCGCGAAVDLIREVLPLAQYSGVDIEASPEGSERARNDAEFRSYDGVHLPYDDASFELVYSRQVLEHVRYPDKVMREIRRVLVPGGVFVGSVSNLEPYHSFSIFNFTPYGVFRVLEDNGLTLETMRPGPEGISLIVRQLTLRRITRFRLAYPLFGLWARIKGWDTRRLNYLRLRFSGHVCFLARRAGDNASD